MDIHDRILKCVEDVDSFDEILKYIFAMLNDRVQVCPFYILSRLSNSSGQAHYDIFKMMFLLLLLTAHYFFFGVRDVLRSSIDEPFDSAQD